MDKLITRRRASRGVSLIELLIAMAIAVMTITVVIQTIGGNQSAISDGEIYTGALHAAETLVQKAASQARTDFLGLSESTATDCSSGVCYSTRIVIDQRYATQCSAIVSGIVNWTGTYGRHLTVGASSTVVDIPGLLALGGDCETALPTGGWEPPVEYAWDTFGGKPTALDALDHIVYMGEDNSPWLRIADARGTGGGSVNIFIPEPYANSFNVSGDELDEINDIEVFKDTSTGKVYLFTATASSTAALSVIDVTDPLNPVIASGAGGLAKRGLAGATTAQGWRLFYYDKRIYIVSKNNAAGKELHVFNVADPKNPIEVGSGYELGTTVQDLAVSRGIGYFAAGTDVLTRQLIVLNGVSDPSTATELTGASRNFGVSASGQGVFYLNKKIYLALEKNSGSELYLLDASSPLTASGGLPILAQQEIDYDVTDVQAVGPFAFIAVSHPSEEFQVYPSTLVGSAISKFNFGNVVNAGFDYDNDWVFASGMSTPNLTILHSPPPQPFDYTLTTPANVALVRAGAQQTTTFVASVTTGSGTISFSNSALPSGVSVSYAPSTCSSTCTISATLSAASDASVTASPQSVTVIGSAPSHTTSFTVSVTAPAFSYTISNPADFTINRGGAVVPVTVTATMTAGAVAQPITITAPNPGGGVVIAPNAIQSCTPTETAPYTCSVTFNYSAPAGASTSNSPNYRMNASPNAEQSAKFRIKVQ